MASGTEFRASADDLPASLRGESAAELVLLAAQALRVGSLEQAASVCDAWTGAPEPALQLTRAAALFGLGEQRPAIELVEQVLAASPEHLVALFYLAQMAQQTGDPTRATELLLRVLERFPDFPGAQGALASMRLPGPPYRAVLRRLHELQKPRNYLEIGVESGATLALARAAERAVGVDPDQDKLRPELVPPCARVFHTTSDAFFREHTLASCFGGKPVDLAFIDGMHWFEYALRDFINVEAWSGPETVVVLHDCLPVFPLTASRERRTRFWVGDVWKVVSILRQYRPELRIKIIATAPSGLCVVRGLVPGSRVLSERFDEIVEAFKEAPYTAPALGAPEGFDLVPATEAGVAEALGRALG